MKRIAVFAGPSLPPEHRAPIEGVVYLPSARRGDLLDAVDNYDAILLIDGVFQEDLAPSPKEVLQACRECAFFGAASLGALRAVECAPYGAHACGAIARWYANGTIDGDDEVAVVFDPKTQRALSVPMVNVRYFLYAAQRRNLIDPVEAERAALQAREVFYADRTWDDVFDTMPRRNKNRLYELARYADLKALDARFALRCVARWAGVKSKRSEETVRIAR